MHPRPAFITGKVKTVVDGDRLDRPVNREDHRGWRIDRIIYVVASGERKRSIAAAAMASMKF
jgi:hypothetical protein